jgi:hypothetical protein
MPRPNSADVCLVDLLIVAFVLTALLFIAGCTGSHTVQRHECIGVIQGDTWHTVEQWEAKHGR